MKDKMIDVEYMECGCCGHWHRSNYWGDCRNDAERFVSIDGDEFESCEIPEKEADAHLSNHFGIDSRQVESTLSSEDQFALEMARLSV